MRVRVLAAIVIAILAFGCTTNSTQAPTQAPAAQAASPAGFKNLKVLPRDLTCDQLLAIMRTFTRSLGVKCNTCHVVTATEPKEELDFASDAKNEKRVARVMIQMTRQINDVARPLGITLHDHIIIGKAGHASLRGLKLI